MTNFQPRGRRLVYYMGMIIGLHVIFMHDGVYCKPHYRDPKVSHAIHPTASSTKQCRVKGTILES